MQYMAIIYSDPDREPQYGTPAFEAMMKGYFSFTEFLKGKGAFIAGDGLQGINAATSVRVKGGKVETMDGPFAETKEHLGGYYLMEVPDLDTAIQYAAMIPSASYGTVELRPVMNYS
ncbi:MAG TPA: YciI family protein [Paracoccaceae bacterium]|nr:YciI family protein [Paracoccaceae bacterium]